VQTFVDTTVILSPDDFSYIDEPHPAGEVITVEPSVTGTELVFAYRVKSDDDTNPSTRPRQELWHVIPAGEPSATFRQRATDMYDQVIKLRDDTPRVDKVTILGFG